MKVFITLCFAGNMEESATNNDYIKPNINLTTPSYFN